MKSILLLILLIAGSELRAIALDDCGARMSDCHSVQAKTYKSVFEQLKATSIAQGHTLQLSATPAPQFPFHLFRSGLELVPGSDYTIDGNVVTLTPKGIEGADPLFEAAYVKQVSTAPSDASSSQTRAARSSGSDEILNRYLQQSLQREMGAYRAPDENGSLVQTPQPHIPEPTIPKRRVPSVDAVLAAPRNSPVGADDPESLRMLSDALTRSITTETSRRTTETNGRKQRSYSHRDDSREADGLEGIGDALTGSPYDILANGSGGLGSALKEIDSVNGQTSPSDRSASHKGRTPESLRLLEQRLSHSDQN